MAIRATASLGQARTDIGANSIRHIAADTRNIARMRTGAMARLAEEGLTCFQHALCSCAMRVVTITAIFDDWLMVMHEGATFLSMAGKASGINRIFDQ